MNILFIDQNVGRYMWRFYKGMDLFIENFNY